jgi:hypothetical protein
MVQFRRWRVGPNPKRAMSHLIKWGRIMVTTLSKLVEEIQAGAIPEWLHTYVEANRDAIASELRQNGKCTLKGPEGIEVTIEAEKQVAAA